MRPTHQRKRNQKKWEEAPSRGAIKIIKPTDRPKVYKRKCNQRYKRRIYKQNNLNNTEHDYNTCINPNCMLCANLYITNLSNVTLTEAQVRLLNKGFGFAPAARDANTFELLRDFNQFCWKLCKFSKTRTRRGVLNKYSCGKIKKETFK